MAGFCTSRGHTPNYRGTDDKRRDWLGSYGNGPKGIFRENTTEVDFFGTTNALGLSGMHGNILEWCTDHWHDNYTSAPTNGEAWLTDNEEANRVSRGGSWNYDPRRCRSATRYHSRPSDKVFFIGLRVCCTTPKTLQPEKIEDTVNTISRILSTLGESYDETTTIGQGKIATKAIGAIEDSPLLKRKLINAMKADGAAAIEEAIDHPAVKTVIAALKGYIDT